MAALEPAAADGAKRRVVRVKVVQASDVRLRNTPVYRWARRASLLLSFAFVVLVPLFNVHMLEREVGGRGGGGLTSRVASLSFPSAELPAVGAPTSIELFSLELVDPVFITSVLLAAGPSVTLLVAGAIAFSTVLLLGRFFCGWICPYTMVVAVSDASRALLAKLGLRPPDVALPRRTARWILGVLVIASALAGSQLVPLFYPPALIGREVFRAVYFGTLGSGAAVLLSAFAFDLFVSRAGVCRYLCPGGALFGMVGALSPIRVVRVAKDCTDCTICDQVCTMLQSPMTDQVDGGCDRCGKCVGSCPTQALSFRLALPSRVARSKQGGSSEAP